jgi:hypothetical protein
MQIQDITNATLLFAFDEQVDSVTHCTPFKYYHVILIQYHSIADIVH